MNRRQLRDRTTNLQQPKPVESLEGRTYFTAFSFSRPTDFAAGTNPSDVVTADLANSGQNDVIVSDYGSATVAVLRGNGNGTFQPPVFYAVGTSPEALTIADFNGDGIPDIVTVNEGSNDISVLIGNGDGTFQPQMNYAVGLRPEAVAVADLNSDGHVDIVAANEGSGDVSVLLNTGTGTFQPAVNYSTGVDPDGVAIGDLSNDGHPDIVTVNPTNNNLHVLLNDGDGVFGVPGVYLTGIAARAVGIADFNSDGRPDIVTANLHDATVSLLLNNPVDNTFQTQQTTAVGAFPFSITIADVNGDGRADVITANNSANRIGILRRTGMGSFVPQATFVTGRAPVAVAVADVNDDGRPDLISADFNTASISVLTNYSTFVPLVHTTTTLSPKQNPVQLHNGLQLTAQITPDGLGAVKPVGVVQFFDGPAVIGVTTINGAGVAKVVVTKLAVGTHTITAHYGGDSVYAASLSTVLTEVVVTAADAVPFVAPRIAAVRLPAVYTPGARGTVTVAIDNNGAGVARGKVSVQLFTSTRSTFDSTATPLTILGNPVFAVQLAGGTTRLAGVNFTMPTTIDAGNYTIFAALTPVSGLTSSQVGTALAVGINTAQAVLAVGTVGRQRVSSLTRNLNDGTVVRIAVTGPGTANFTEDSIGGISIALTGTSVASNVTITSTGDTLNSLTASSAVGNFLAPTMTAVNAVTMQGGVRQLSLAGVTNNRIFLGGSAPSVLSLGTVSNGNLNSTAPVRILTVNSWTNFSQDIIAAPWIGSLNSSGDFGASLNLGGAGALHRVAVATATIGGNLLDSTWSMPVNLGKIQVAGVATGWSGSVGGSVSSFTDTGDFAGQLAALSIGPVIIDGNLTNAAILAGAYFGNDGRLGGGDDLFTHGALTSIAVHGSATNSVVAAGLVPVGTELLGTGSKLLHDSAIRSITIDGAVDTTTRFIAATLPGAASIGGSGITTATDPNFQL